MANYYARKRIYSEPLYKIYQLLEDKDDAYLWDIFYKLVDGEIQSGTVENDGTNIFAKMESRYVESLDDLLRVCDVNLDEHIVDHHRIKTSQTPMKLRTVVGEDEKGNRIFEDKPTKIQAFHILAKLIRKVPEGGIEDAFDRFVEKAESHAPKYPNIKKPKQAERFAEISIYDLHVGKLSWEQETGGNYDTKIALDRFKSAFYDLVDRSLDLGCDELVIPLGNDLINIDNAQSTTTNGTPQDVDTRWQYMLDKTEDAFIECLDYAGERAKIHVMYVPGNHDEQYSYFITKYLYAWYKNHKNITVDKSPTLTKYYQNGVNMIAYNHFKDVKPEAMPQVMSTNQPIMWAETWYREAHGGHFHTRKTKGVTIDTYEEEHRGVLYRVMPSLCETDAWHKRKEYDGNIKSAISLVYDKQGGFYEMLNHIPD